MKLSDIPESWRSVITLSLRWLIGLLFVVSGFAKTADLWGFVFKLEEYLSAWAAEIPRSLVFCLAMAVAGFEFVVGALLALGCYRRFAPWALTVMMAFMVPLTAYIWLANPVDDCGCFGEMLHLSNWATFAKNILILAALLWLVAFNAKVKCRAFTPAIQWLAVTLLSAYIICVGLYGYVVQPMLDFRPFPIGSALVASEDLPQEDATELAVFDEDGDDVAPVLFGPDSGDQILISIPQLNRADLSLTYPINELYQYADSADIHMFALMGTGPKGIEAWRDLSMAEYPIYQADDTELRSLARGNIALILLRNGKVWSKSDLSSYELADIEEALRSGKVFEMLKVQPTRDFWSLTLLFLILLLALGLGQGLILEIRRHIHKKITKTPAATPST